MSTTETISEQAQVWSGPGIMQLFVKLRANSNLSQEILEKWFNEVYLPAVLNTGIVKAITSWKAANPNYERPWMIVFEIGDLSLVQHGNRNLRGSELHQISRTSEMFPSSGPVDDFVDFETRILKQIQLYGSSGNSADEVTTIIFAAMQPAPGGEKDLDAWYREEHNEQMAREPGYKRTTRYSPLFQTRNVGTPAGLDFVALHQFGDKNEIGSEVKPLDPMTDWTKRCMGECTSIDAAVYRKFKTFTP